MGFKGVKNIYACFRDVAHKGIHLKKYILIISFIFNIFFENKSNKNISTCFMQNIDYLLSANVFVSQGFFFLIHIKGNFVETKLLIVNSKFNGLILKVFLFYVQTLASLCNTYH